MKKSRFFLSGSLISLLFLACASSSPAGEEQPVPEPVESAEVPAGEAETMDAAELAPDAADMPDISDAPDEQTEDLQVDDLAEPSPEPAEVAAESFFPEADVLLPEPDAAALLLPPEPASVPPPEGAGPGNESPPPPPPEPPLPPPPPPGLRPAGEAQPLRLRPAEEDPSGIIREPLARPVQPPPASPEPEIEALAPPPPASGGEIVFSRIIRATVGQLVEIPFRGTGWVYLGELGARRGVNYESRRLEPEGQSFVFRAEAAGTYALKFYKQDFIRDYILNDYVQVIVGEAPETSASGWFSPSLDRGRVRAERWPNAIEEADALGRSRAGTPA
ncbi:MAG: hypothetical protein LBK02_05545, partial [Treponema sp.]|nr:hypothetical protein [Treponema sp.]